MNASPANLAVWVNDQFACVKITGRAGCACSVDFRKLILGLRAKGWRRFVLDLTECQLMDSTFLGVLAWLGLRFSEETDSPPLSSIELLNPSERVFLIKHGKDSVLAKLDLCELRHFIPILSGTTTNVQILHSLIDDLGTDDPDVWLPPFLERTAA